MYTRLKKSLSRLSGKARPRLRSLRLRVMGLVILALLPAFGLMVFTASESRSQAIEQTQQNAMRLTELAVANQRQLIDGARDILITLAQLPAIQEQDRAACVFFLSNVLMQHPLYANFGAADGNGSVYCMTLPQRVPFSIADQDYFQQSMSSRDFALSEYQISPTNSQAVITLSYPVVDDQGYPQGIVFASLDLRWLGPFMNAASLPEGSTLRVIDRNGVILVSYPNGEIEIGQMMPESSIAGLIVAQSIGLTQGHDASGVARLYAYTPLHAGADSDVYMIISIPTEAAFAISNSILQRNMLALVIGAVLALATTWLGTQFFFLRQVNSLVDTTQRLSAGDLSARTGWGPGQGELGQLARAFDEMATTLQHREQEQQWAQEQIRKQTERAEALARIAGRLNAKLELDSVLQEVCDETCRALNVPAVAVVVHQKAEKDLFYLSGPDLDSNLKTHMNASSRTRVERASSQLDELTMQVDLAAHPRLLPSNVRRLLVARFMIYVDLIHEGSTIGRLNLFTRENALMGEDELTLLEGIANSAALAITNARLYTELRMQEQFRADLLHQVIGVQEDERMRISRELHDETSQSLTALLLGLDTINIAAQSDITRIKGHTRQLKSVTEDMLDNIHRLIADLRPSLLDDLGLVAAIEWYGEQRLKPYGISFDLEQTLDGRLPRPVETALFRIVQEGMTNIVRHAKASVVVVRLIQEHDLVSLEICDNGVGFIPQRLDTLESNGRGLGLRGIQERAAILGGTMDIDSTIGAGTVVRICFHTYRSEEIKKDDSYSTG
jgi:signal transduction histidine kinase/HAMP domain-containing protein